MSEKRKKSDPVKLIVIPVCAVAALGVIFYILAKYAVPQYSEIPAVPRYNESPAVPEYSENPLENIRQESADIPNYVVHDMLYSEYGITDIEQICQEQNKYYYVSEVFCIRNGKVYFMYENHISELNDDWYVGSIDLETSEFRTCCEMPDAEGKYYIDFKNPYRERSGYYLEGQITLIDYDTVLVYDIDADTSRTYAYKDYEFPECTVYGERTDSETICLNIGDFSKSYTLQQMAEKSDAIAGIYALKDEKTVYGYSYLDRCFSRNCVQVVNGKIYAVGECRDYDRNTYAMILEYDERTDSWMYVTNAQTPYGYAVEESCYVIP